MVSNLVSGISYMSTMKRDHIHLHFHLRLSPAVSHSTSPSWLHALFCYLLSLTGAAPCALAWGKRMRKSAVKRCLTYSMEVTLTNSQHPWVPAWDPSPTMTGVELLRSRPLLRSCWQGQPQGRMKHSLRCGYWNGTCAPVNEQHWSQKLLFW